MATVTELVDYVVDTARFSTTGSERTKALSYLNAAYQWACMRSEAIVLDDFALTVSTAGNSFNPQLLVSASSAKPPIQIVTLSVRPSGTTGSRVVTPVDRDRMADLRINGSADAPTMSDTGSAAFHILSPAMAHIYPAVSVGDVITVEGVAAGKTLVESAPGTGQESTPTGFPDAFHIPVIGSRAVAYAKEFDSSSSTSGPWTERASLALMELERWVSSFGFGDGIPPVRRVVDLPLRTQYRNDRDRS